MHFILDPNFINLVSKLRDTYQDEKGVKLGVPVSMWGLPFFLGGINIAGRSQQVLFLEKIIASRQSQMLQKGEMITVERYQSHLMASQIIIAACLHVQSQIGCSTTNSVLFRNINKALGITPENYLDDEDKKACFISASLLLNHDMTFQELNKALKSNAFTAKEFADFAKFIEKSCKHYDIPATHNDYPITTFVQPVFCSAFSWAGSTLGWVAADALSSSSAAARPRAQLALIVGSGLLYLTPVGVAGAVFLAPTIAAQLLTSFFALSASNIGGRAMGTLGNVAASAVFLPVDLALNLIKTLCALIINYCKQTSPADARTGFRIADGAIIINGMLIEMTNTSLPAGIPLLTITDSGKVLVNGEKVAADGSKIALVIEQLETLLTTSNELTEVAETETVEGKLSEVVAAPM